MDTRSGQIVSDTEAKKWDESDRKYLERMVHHPTLVQRARGKVSRNEPCPCGSQKKFKKCCLMKITKDDLRHNNDSEFKKAARTMLDEIKEALN